MLNHSVDTKIPHNATSSEAVPVATITIILSILIVLSILSNFLVCYAFIIQPRLRRAIYYPVLNLAVADILCGLLAMTSYLAKKHVFGGTKQQIVCDISRFSYFVTEYASVLSLTIISGDRALAILRPLTYTTTVTSWRMKCLLFLTWCYAILVSSLPFFWRSRFNKMCWFQPTKTWSLLVIIINVLLPFMVIFLCQGAIYTIAIRHSLDIRRQRRGMGLRANKSGSDLRRGSTPQREAWRVERKATIGLSIVVGLFLVCWGPSSFYYFLQKVAPGNFKGTFGRNEGTFNAVVKLLTFANSCFNPCIYAWLNNDFRCAFVRVFTRRLYQAEVKKQVSYTIGQQEHFNLKLINGNSATPEEKNGRCVQIGVPESATEGKPRGEQTKGLLRHV